ncbi:DMT family transporter [Vulcaniibacterium tengchongense]|uniref:EamA-like transporter family protein n=1 Tax=Vulcaniibacterium tengchongense TaxID=1273429 RepID=A0A3N4VED5_9GAMM|nr:DMT family transporter [Vulcaniibacterium tengchongense]RPE80163.1 EamA-like transporter family protein [Vulcaniibacterium tengchongense]
MNALATRLALTLATGSLVGAGFVLAKLLLNAGASQAAIAFVQLAGAAALMLLALGLGRRLPPRDGVHLRYFLASALIGIAAGPLLGNWVLARIPAGVFTVLVTLSPMFTALFNAALDRRWPPAQTLAGTGLGLAGVLLVLVPRAQAVDAEQGLALAVAVGVPMLLAAGNVYRSRRWPAGLAAPAASAGTLALQAALLAPLFLAGLRGAGGAALLPLWPLLAGLVAVTIASQLAGAYLQKRAGAAAYSQIGYVIALTGVAASALLFGEALGALFWPALALVFAGIVLTNRAPAAAPAATMPAAAAAR